MKPETWIIAVGLVLLIVGINLSLYLTLRRRNIQNQFEPLARAIRRLRQPWLDEDEQIKELSRQVAELKSRSVPAGEQEKPPSNIG